MNLHDLGWSPVWQNAFSQVGDEKLMPARVTSEHRGAYCVATDSGERLAEVSGRFRHCANGRRDFPAVGDWVALEVPDAVSRCLIHAVLPRLSMFLRKAAGPGVDEQVVAANVDVVFLVSGLDNDFNVRRIERYVTLAYESGAGPVIVLNKADVAEDLEQARLDAEAVACGIPVLVASAATGTGLESMRKCILPGTTGALLGSSGVGKSSLLNALLGREAMKTAEVREDDSRGRHTTSHRQLIPVPGGGVLIDTPGMREIQLLADDVALNRSFDEIAALAESCRFHDCSHTGEPGCAVLAALAEGKLAPERYESYLRLRKEIRHHQVEQNIHLQIAEKNRWKSIHKSLRHHHKWRRGDQG